MTTFTALTTLTGEDAAYDLAEAVEALQPEPTGVGVFEVEDGSGVWEVGGYFTERPDAGALAVLSALHNAKPFLISEVPDQDWVAKVQRELAPVRAGRFFVYGSHDADKAPQDCVPLLIDAAMAFGTGHHGTTKGCLDAFDELVTKRGAPETVLDLGCGTAVLAMAAAKVGSQTVVASDIDPVAIDVANANLVVNDLAGQVQTFVGAGFDAAGVGAAGPYDLIFANILKPPLLALAPSIAAGVKPGGYAILSGILNDQAEEVMTAYRQNGFNVAKTHAIVEWTTIVLRRD